ncbi:MAG: hypothetical protein A3B04_01895 [Candidatus Portnoybacteria bacterium RIFCSPLOWO2_02_FULL_39_11]|uniref:Uncharacterized protein n=1 Tax=Candidatus Portnoybacteria bacterium RIFCSPLOWO2_02_FULL_39_11 TaxID=1802001 RepID=A0A1G2FQN2_9BACT|nr:MAG: hypothetical protein A3B04_01895 [Candidatus Portnoybacteria bacterium RIFCSPLOWO2_02_FULL_39_11]
MPENKLGLNWSAAERALAEGTFSGYKIGILETEKLFEELLKTKQIPGDSTNRKIKYIQRFLSLPDKLDYSRHVYERIINEPHFEISRDETKHIISGYWQAMLDIEEAVSSLGVWEKISLRAKYILAIAIKNTRNVVIAILATSAVIWFLAETNIGKTITNGIIIANHFFIFKFLLWTVIVLVVLFIIGGILYFVTKRKRRF